MEFEVKDMSCGGCASAITRAVANVDPAARLDVDISSKIVKIDSVLPPQRLAAAIEAAGFHPVVCPPSAD
ncbi:heavy-metal-associated domain-containing protein [Paraburkholderia sp. MMS20-SJTN17]|uniref:Heavy-metal-associated domain-containing protein n=1 Tax=Paraburkholderia translucens TaxID=2886945 RepID=A0ABS8KGQ1_9BURK|nr:heavy-metal-associated domain-containing protein [Paraburkholderia sp. MMS20-SJTN17]MCC8403557.1 heavy-metal-associated domain-containing protein [Paraburkholderia sp. MMS20-SJTN17]